MGKVEKWDSQALMVEIFRHFVCMTMVKSTEERATRVRTCNYVKIETERNFPPVQKIVTHTAQAA